MPSLVSLAPCRPHAGRLLSDRGSLSLLGGFLPIKRNALARSQCKQISSRRTMRRATSGECGEAAVAFPLAAFDGVDGGSMAGVRLLCVVAASSNTTSSSFENYV